MHKTHQPGRVWGIDKQKGSHQTELKEMPIRRDEYLNIGAHAAHHHRAAESAPARFGEDQIGLELLSAVRHLVEELFVRFQGRVVHEEA